jgi:hypothetical protein
MDNQVGVVGIISKQMDGVIMLAVHAFVHHEDG